MRLSLKDFSTDILSPKASALVSEFALILYRAKGVLINVESDEALLEIFKNAKYYRNDRLQYIFLHIEAELSNNIINSVPHCDTISLHDSLIQSASKMASPNLCHG